MVCSICGLRGCRCTDLDALEQEAALQKISYFGQDQEQKPVAWIGLPGKGTPLYAAPPAPAAVPPCHVAVIGHRFDPVNQTHVPQVLLEFEPVPVNSPNDAKGWQDRDALAAMIAAAGDKP